MITIEQVKQLREETDVSISECKKALEQTEGDFDKAKEILRAWGKELAGKKSGREAREGIIQSYIHPNNKVGVLIELRSETDFVSKTKDFQNLGKEICLQIAAMKPLYINAEDIPEAIVDGEKKIYEEQVKDSGKPEEIVNQIIEGKIKKYKESISLMSQPWVKDDSKTIKDLIEEYIGKVGENVGLKAFQRFEI